MEQFIIFILGLAVGSFLNAYVFRLHSGKSVWHGRSCCPKCGKILRWFELIPLVSFVIQLGRCRGCKKQIDIQYPIVELTTGILFVLGWGLVIGIWGFVGIWSLVIGHLAVWYLMSILVVLFVYDLRYGLVPDRVVLPAIVIAFAYQIHNSYFMIHDSLIVSIYALIAVVAGTLFFAVQYYISKGRWLGAGDIRIGALMGAMLGWPLIIEGIVLSYIIGGAVALALLACGKKKFGQTLPLGTFLTLGTAIVFLYGEQIWNWYW